MLDGASPAPVRAGPWAPGATLEPDRFMASPGKKRSTPKPSASFDRYPPRPTSEPPEVVDPRWLLKALGVTLAAAAVLGYLSVCLLVYLGGWQLMLHPGPKAATAPSVPYQAIRFDAAATGSPRLSGWWIPAAVADARTPTLLYLRGGSGSLGANAAKLALLHQLPVNVFAFDYRGYGDSAGPHPTEERMLEDAMAAVDYLENTRHLGQIVPYGEGLGAVIAAKVVQAHPELAAVVVDSPVPDAFDKATGSGKSRLLPMRLLLRERFDLAGALSGVRVPKLLLANSPGDGLDEPAAAANLKFFRTVPDPRTSVVFAQTAAEAPYLEALRRFLDNTVPR